VLLEVSVEMQLSVQLEMLKLLIHKGLPVLLSPLELLEHKGLSIYKGLSVRLEMSVESFSVQLEMLLHKDCRYY
jgi:hypothetical protein